MIEDADIDLDRQLAAERRPSERLRMLRHSTRLMTQAGNDAVLAYRSGLRALDKNRHGLSPAQTSAILVDFHRVRGELLVALEMAGRRYPWTAAPGSSSSTNAPT